MQPDGYHEHFPQPILGSKQMSLQTVSPSCPSTLYTMSTHTPLLLSSFVGYADTSSNAQQTMQRKYKCPSSCGALSDI